MTARAMPDDGGSGACPAPLTERQEERRRRILRAGAELAARGGFDGVQMREVAELSGVALGTLYRYFPSKVHLLVATMRDRLERVHESLRGRPLRGETAAERVAETLIRAFHAFRGEPRLADAVVRALTFADRSVSAEVERVSSRTAAIILDAVGPGGPGAEGAPAVARVPGSGPASGSGPGPGAGCGCGSAVRVIGHAWHAVLVAWVSGRASVAEVEADIVTVSRLIDT
ncbi:TetR family transcriptional regulator [Streptomyces sp. SID4919]|uniref:TetR family transcriptional regulator n=1 Tax=unclassified Streptomyces TaxID=2593676 RepID=UPI000823A4A5|nr:MULTISPECIES: TetR family transcriptional regulator [unclassified Streptomyces]MYY13694.1 TetR family transcriptional regulator [Streptomyces sp. SID4919]SCK34264.1 transcriptional regulator, TetR family [Streptomyces sp. AmelKG-E11A]